jgi:hypothetical protein
MLDALVVIDHALLLPSPVYQSEEVASKRDDSRRLGCGFWGVHDGAGFIFADEVSVPDCAYAKHGQRFFHASLVAKPYL